MQSEVLLLFHVHRVHIYGLKAVICLLKHENRFTLWIFFLKCKKFIWTYNILFDNETRERKQGEKTFIFSFHNRMLQSILWKQQYLSIGWLLEWLITNRNIIQCLGKIISFEVFFKSPNSFYLQKCRYTRIFLDVKF